MENRADATRSNMFQHFQNIADGIPKEKTQINRSGSVSDPAEARRDTDAPRQRSSMEDNKNINAQKRQQATAMSAFPKICDSVVRWDDVKKTLTYSSSSSDSSLGRAWSSSSSSASCFLLRVDIVLDWAGVQMEWMGEDGVKLGWRVSCGRRWGPVERHLGPSHLPEQSKGTLAS